MDLINKLNSWDRFDVRLNNIAQIALGNKLRNKVVIFIFPIKTF